MRSALLALTFVCAAMLPACFADESSEYTPRSGTWDFAGSDPVDDTCGYPDLYVDPPGEFVLDSVDASTFTVTTQDAVFNCTLEGNDFSCPERLSGEYDVGAAFQLDAVVIYKISIEGSLSSDTQMSGRQLFEIECDGADCAAVETSTGVMTPCGWTQSFTAQAR